MIFGAVLSAASLAVQGVMLAGKVAVGAAKVAWKAGKLAYRVTKKVAKAGYRITKKGIKLGKKVIGKIKETRELTKANALARVQDNIQSSRHFVPTQNEVKPVTQSASSVLKESNLFGSKEK